MLPELVQLSEKLASRVNTGKIAIASDSENTIRVEPKGEDTFPIIVSFQNDRFELEAGNWHGHYEKLEQASSIVCWLLTPYYRIVESRAQNQPIAAWLELYTDQGWESTDTVYFVDPNCIESPVENADEINILVQAVFLDSSFASHFPAAHLDQAGYPTGTLIGTVKYELREDGWYPVGVPVAE